MSPPDSAAASGEVSGVQRDNGGGARNRYSSMVRGAGSSRGGQQGQWPGCRCQATPCVRQVMLCMRTLRCQMHCRLMLTPLLRSRSHASALLKTQMLAPAGPAVPLARPTLGLSPPRSRLVRRVAWTRHHRSSRSLHGALLQCKGSLRPPEGPTRRGGCHIA